MGKWRRIRKVGRKVIDFVKERLREREKGGKIDCVK